MNYSWSKKEKEVARKAFDLAHENKLKEIIEAVKNFKLETWQDLAALSDFIKKKEREVDNTFDYRYSVLIMSFASFIREGLITQENLKGLSEEKISKIRDISRL